MPLNLLLAWWNLIYVVPFGLAVTYLALYVFTGITFGDADADAGLHLDHDVDMDADADGPQLHVEAHVVEADGDLDHDADVDNDADGNNAALAVAGGAGGSAALSHHMPEHEFGADHSSTDRGVAGGGSFVQSVLSLLGVGKIPVSLILMILLLLWGTIGFILNQMLTGWLGPVFFIGLITAPITGIISVSLTALAARVIGKFLPTMETYASRWHQLVGRAGEAIYDINATFGMVSVRDTRGDLFQVPCRTADGKPVIPKGSRVVLFDYDPEKGVFHVAPLAI